MLPSSRTPEGEPVHCSICGHEAFLEISQPPGDTVCPACGSHAWYTGHVASTMNNKRPSGTVAFQIDAFQDHLKAMCQESTSSKAELSVIVSLGLMQSLAAHGVSLWFVQKKRWLSLRVPLENASQFGERCTGELARKAMALKRDLSEVRSEGACQRLVIAVPIIRGKRVIGAIEVNQRAECSPRTHDGCLRFVQKIADQLATAPALAA